MTVAGLPIELWSHIVLYAAVDKVLYPLLTVSRAVGAVAERALYRDGLARFIEQDVARPIWRRITSNTRLAGHIRALSLFPLDRDDLELVGEVLQATPNLKSVYLGLTDFIDPALELTSWSIVVPMSASIPFQLRSLTVRTQDYDGMRQFMHSHRSINHLEINNGILDQSLPEDIPNTVQFSPEDVPGLERLSVDDTELAIKFLPHCTFITRFELSSVLSFDGLEECSAIRIFKCRSTLQQGEIEKIPGLFPNLEFLIVCLNGLVPAFDAILLRCKNLRKLKIWVNDGELAGWIGWAESVLIDTLVAGSGRSYLEVIELVKIQDTQLGDQPYKVDIAVIRMGGAAPRQLQQLSIQGEDLETQKNEWMWWGTKEGLI